MEAKQVRLTALLFSVVLVATIEAAGAVFALLSGVRGATLLGLVRIVEVCTLIGIVIVWGKGLASIGLNLSRVGFGFRMGLIWSAGFAAVAALAYLSMLALGFNPMSILATPTPKGAREVLLLFLVGGLTAPIAEEIFFRGLVFGFFRRWGFWVALVVSTTLFVLIHPMGGRLPVTQVVGGIVFAVAYEREGSLLTPITIHCLGNMALFSLSLIYPT
jgi:hypothetical protein